jgi:hypothetical protein
VAEGCIETWVNVDLDGLDPRVSIRASWRYSTNLTTKVSLDKLDLNPAHSTSSEIEGRVIGAAHRLYRDPGVLLPRFAPLTHAMGQTEPPKTCPKQDQKGTWRYNTSGGK